MNVADVMTRSIVTVSRKNPYKELWTAIFKKKINALPVVDSKGFLLGIVAEEDLLRPLYPDYGQIVDDFASARDFEAMEQKVKELSALTAESIMSRKIIFARPTTPLMRALSRMIVRSVNQLPVLSEDNKIIGMVTKGDIFQHLFLHQISGSVIKQETQKHVASKTTRVRRKK